MVVVKAATNEGQHCERNISDKLWGNLGVDGGGEAATNEDNNQRLNNRKERLPSAAKDGCILSEGDIPEEEPIKDPCRLNYKFYDRLYG
ncbi:hypothetical protein HAX54_015505 [Datura stramonium]|uniref:Uncharacterized protein n=1 Tax=Datura stramonium TaxID=4076 RepID=A0ABS8Y4M8_DATST|nr:hypothetical protein [Datura stramonium]